MVAETIALFLRIINQVKNLWHNQSDWNIWLLRPYVLCRNQSVA